jgi:hypothetical protein
MSPPGAEATKSGLLAQHWGPNGVEVEIWNETAPYAYANMFHVRLRVDARVPGAAEPYRRRLERIGVYSEDLVRAQRELIAAFESQSLPYLFSTEFPRRFAEHLERKKSNVVRFPVQP